VGAGSGEVYFEFIRVGAAMRVSAIDGRTGIEVTVMGPAHAAQSDLERLALAKLKRRLAQLSE
jgi:precorrin-6B methylase 2